MKNSIKTIKKVHKTLANEIRYLKSLRKEDKVDERPGKLKEPWNLDYEIFKLSSDYRLRHLAYCFNRGREYKEIEPKVHAHKELSSWDWSKINKYKEEYRKLYEEDVRANEQTA